MNKSEPYTGSDENGSDVLTAEERAAVESVRNYSDEREDAGPPFTSEMQTVVAIIDRLVATVKELKEKAQDEALKNLSIIGQLIESSLSPKEAKP